MVRAHWNGVVIAESDDTVVIDGNHHFPADAVSGEYLVASDTSTVCPWKGRSSYYSLRVDGNVSRDAARFYPAPSSAIAGRIAFWHGVKIEDGGTAARRRSFFDRFRREPPVPAAAPAAVPAGGDQHSHDAPVIDVDDASGKYFVWIGTSTIFNSKATACAMSWVSNTKSSELRRNGIVVRSRREYAR